MPNSIVQLFVSQSVAPAPLTLQQTGAVISQGGTTLAQGVYALLTQPADLTPLLAAALAITTLAWSSGTVLATTAAPIPGLTTGNTFITTIAGATPAGYNGLVLATVTGASTFTYALAVNPGTATVAGTYTPPSQGALLAKVGTFFGQGTSQAVYVLELGPSNGATGPTALSAWIIANPNIFYSYLVPRGWDGQANFLTLIAQYEALTAKVNFFVTTTVGNYSAYTALMSPVFAMVEAPGIPLTEFSCAAPFQHSLQYRPSSSNRVTPFNYSFLFGVTPYPTVGNSTLLTNLNTANINYVGTGAEGGISNAILIGGKMADGRPFNYWYSADWIQITGTRAVANEVINGSNNPLNPLYYNQDGVNRVQDVLLETVRNGITFGLANGTAARAALDGPDFGLALDNDVYLDQDVVNAVPFITYVKENPGAYAAGSYGGLSVVWIPQRGFDHIIFNINITDFVAGA